MGYTVEKTGSNKYTVQPVVRHGEKYVLMFNMDKDDCTVFIYEYRTHKRLLQGHKGSFVNSCVIKNITSRDGETIENVAQLTDYGFRKYLSEIIDATFVY